MHICSRNIRNTDDLAHNFNLILILWKPKNGIYSVLFSDVYETERQPKTFIYSLNNDCDYKEYDKVKTLIMEREGISRSGIPSIDENSTNKYLLLILIYYIIL